MKNTRKITVTAVFTALYLVLSAMLKIPVAGHITLDMGYIALTVGAVYLGAIPAAVIGGCGALLESAVMSLHGISPGWTLMNVIVGYCCGRVLKRKADAGRKKFLLAAAAVIPSSMLVGVAVKTAIDCAMYGTPLPVKLPVSAVAWLADSLVMLCIGIPLSMALKKRIHSFF